MGSVKQERSTVTIQKETHYVLVMVTAGENDQVRNWFENLSASSELEAVFTADIRGKAPLEKPIGLVALLKFGTTSQMKATITRMATELGQRDRWTFDFMKANWIGIHSGLAAREWNENKRLVTTDGRISFRNRRYHISERLRGECVELSVDNENLNVYHDGVLVKTLRLRS